jgi:ankyrin repeat protein
MFNIFSSCIEGCIEDIIYFIDLGISVNDKSLCDRTPLSYASEHGHSECVKFLLQAGANADEPAYNEWTPLYWASYNNHTETAKLLLDYGANAHKTVHGWIPLFIAAKQDHIEMVKLLIDHSNLNFTTFEGQRVFDVATGDSKQYILSLYHLNQRTR